MGPSLAVLGARESAPGGSDTRQLPPALSSGFVVAEMITLELFFKKYRFLRRGDTLSDSLLEADLSYGQEERDLF